MKILMLLIPLLLLTSCSEKKAVQSERYSAGFKIIQTRDSSRVYKPHTNTSDYLHFRPLDIDIWYPASVSSVDTTLLFRDILGLLEKRANYYTASNAADGMTQQIAQYFCAHLKCSDSTKVLHFKTQSFKNAPAVAGKFPLVIYLSAFNGMSYENFILLEELSKKGFVVASINSIGRFPGDMTMKNEDMMEQVSDALATLDILKGSSTIDFTKIGIVGYSWGGLAAAVLAAKIPNVACLVSLDGSEFHHYGSSKEEDADFKGIKNSQNFNKMQISAPYLRLESSSAGTNTKKEVIYDFSEKLRSEKRIFKIDSAQHEDFCCLPQLVKKSGACEANRHFKTVSMLTTAFLEDHLKNKKTFEAIIQQEINRAIRKK